MSPMVVGAGWECMVSRCRFRIMRGLGRRSRIAAAAIIGVAAIAACGSSQDNGRVLPPPSESQASGSGQFWVIGDLQTNGNPEPSVQAGGNGGTWLVCIPGARRCKQLATLGGVARTGPEPAGTIFKINGGRPGHPDWARLTWHGALHVTKPPELSGTPHVGATVRVSAAHWSGGWGSAFDELGIEACHTRRASQCAVLVGMAVGCYRSGCGMGGGAAKYYSPDDVRVGPWYSGWYLFAFDAHLMDDASTALGYPSYGVEPPWPTNRIVVRSRPYGPVTGPPSPTVEFLSHAKLRGRTLLVAAVHCIPSCRAAILVSSKRANARYPVIWMGTERVEGTETVGVSGEPPLPRGRAMVSVAVGSGPYVKGHSIVP